MKTKSKQGKTLSQIKKEFDRVFSIYIRLRDKGVCISCGSKAVWTKMQNGHYVSRAHMSLRYDESNCNCQCVGCNIFKNGNMDEYALALIKKHGNDILNVLNKKKQEIRKWTVAEMEEHISIYKDKIRKINPRIKI